MKKYALAALTLMAVAIPAQAQLPDAKVLVAKYGTAIGADELMKHKSLKMNGTFEMPAMGLSATLEVLRAKPNRSVVRVDLPGMGMVERGFDGTTGWSMNPMQGNSLMAGDELKRTAEESDFGAQTRDLKFFTSVETVEKTKMAGTDCYKVKMVWKSGKTTFDCYAVDTGLLVGNVSSQDTPQGTMEITNIFSDYKQFSGIKFPSKQVQSVMGQEQVLTVTTVEFDTVADSVFVMPAAIQALVPKK